MTLFYRTDDQYFPVPTSDLVEDLPSGIYQLNFHPMKGIYLKRFEEKFHIPDKIYGDKIRIMFNELIKYVDDEKDKEFLEQLDQKFMDWIIKQEDLVGFDLKTGKKVYKSLNLEVKVY